MVGGRRMTGTKETEHGKRKEKREEGREKREGVGGMPNES